MSLSLKSSITKIFGTVPLLIQGNYFAHNGEKEDFSKKEWVCRRGRGGQSQPNILSFWLQMLIVLFCSSGFSFLISPLSFFSFISGSIEPIQPPTHPPGTKLKQWNFSTTIIIFIIHVPSSVLDNAPRDRQRKLTKNLGNHNFCWVSPCLEA